MPAVLLGTSTDLSTYQLQDGGEHHRSLFVETRTLPLSSQGFAAHGCLHRVIVVIHTTGSTRTKDSFH